ncbi:hypothetical protein NDU88_005032 [Pleurodeles waltl]|uniref:Uncharacterized protein n=1 Tax=Pleurodeles waltl TaxID=8319 RepID=A0AAV7PHQ2_PLEWA|nr:hypothetical protein NDU88_005032 [Pleurodeles waltl]
MRSWLYDKEDVDGAAQQNVYSEDLQKALLDGTLPQLIEKLGRLGCALQEEDPSKAKIKTIAVLEEIRDLLKDVTCVAPLLEVVTATLVSAFCPIYDVVLRLCLI